MIRVLSKESKDNRLAQINSYWRAANYLGAIQLYLQDNVLLEKPLAPQHIKPRLVGHWGTQPGLNLIYAHLNRLIQDNDVEVMLVVGPGHGAPAILANLFLEGSLGKFYPALSLNRQGIGELARRFSWPGGFPSHLGPMVPGTMHEGGELGYCLSHAFGAALDNPDLIVACIVGDGEAETGPLAASWHSPKFLDPATCGAVLPILHLNGYKLSGPSIFARMSGLELNQFFRGLGYEIRVVSPASTRDAHVQLWAAMDWAYAHIRSVQTIVRSGRAGSEPWNQLRPIIVLRTPKGWTGPATLDGKPIEGTFHAHQLPIADPASNPAHLRALESWLRSYEPKELFDAEGRPKHDVVAICPTGEKRIGFNNRAIGGGRIPLRLPEYEKHAISVGLPGSQQAEPTYVLGEYLADVFSLNEQQKNFRLFCPDETSSNHLQQVYAATDRAFECPLLATDEFMSRNGRVMEILSEHTCEGWLEGYVLSGRHGIFACYEAFSTIVDSMVTQHAKWLKVAREISWRCDVASLNVLLTSHAWRQDHNGYSHQGPGFIDTLVSKKSSVVRVYLPPDANSLLRTMQHCLESCNYINLIIASKNLTPQWLDAQAARENCKSGASVWNWASNNAGDPEVIMAAAGDAPTLETLAAITLLWKYLPRLRVRMVNVIDLFSLATHEDHPHGLDADKFANLFTVDKPVIFAFHGYPRIVHELIHHRPDPQRFHVRGYIEEGTTTTPFDMTVLNNMSRFHLAAEAIRRSGLTDDQAQQALIILDDRLARHRLYIHEHGVDMPEILQWQWQPKSQR